MRLSELGTPDAPVRLSSLSRLQCCPGFFVLGDERCGVVGDTHSQAADTGTAFHRMAELFHEDPERSFAEIIEQTAEESGGASGRPFPLADLPLAGKWFLPYTRDPRNECDTPYLETRVRLEVDDVVFLGHLDQIRVGDGDRLEVWDIKTGRDSGCDQIYKYAWQQAGYVLAAAETLGEDVWPGGIITPRAYCVRTKPAPGDARVHCRTPWGIRACEEMMTRVAAMIRRIRDGKIELFPGKHCNWCPGVSPSSCGGDLELLFTGEMSHE